MSTKTNKQWRSQPGFFLPGLSNLQTIKNLLHYFLKDRRSPDLLANEIISTGSKKFDWGKVHPVEKIIDSQSNFEHLAAQPDLGKNAVTIIEPWQHVGVNPNNEEVRASLNLAYIIQKVADIDSVLLPAWDSVNVVPLSQLCALASNGLAFVVEGGAPSVYDAKTFTHPQCPRELLLELIQQLLLSRLDGGAPGLFICLGHQLAAEAHMRILKRAVEHITDLTQIPNDKSGTIIKALKKISANIESVGKNFKVTMQDGSVHASGWDDEQFATTHNITPELSGHMLSPYVVPTAEVLGVPDEVVEFYELTAANEDVVDVMLEFAGELKIDMFHGDIATEQAALFANWAYMSLHNVLAAYREEIAVSPLSWLLQLPYAVKISSSTRSEKNIITANAATCILYKDFETGKIKHSYTTQFHPELMDDLKDFRARKAPIYDELKKNAGTRLLIRLLKEAVNN